MHAAGTIEEVSRSEADVSAGMHPERPFCLVTQPCVVDPSRAPTGQHTLWGYCHVPAGWDVSMADRIEAQIERFAPGFRDLILARSVKTAADMERDNPSYVGGDIGAGAGTLRQTVGRPTLRWNPYRTPLTGSTSARDRHRQAGECTGCAVSGQPGLRCTTCTCLQILLRVG